MSTVAKNVPVECAGVTVRPGDIIVADEDGVVVPQERAAEVLKQAQSIDERETGMCPSFASSNRCSTRSPSSTGFDPEVIAPIRLRLT